MTVLKSVNLMLKSSNNNPYSGMLSKKDNIIAAIELAKLCKEFADNGQSDEAMNLDSNHWEQVINKLKLKQNDKTN
jgi:mitochondrial fission protein ELM1